MKIVEDWSINWEGCFPLILASLWEGKFISNVWLPAVSQHYLATVSTCNFSGTPHFWFRNSEGGAQQPPSHMPSRDSDTTEFENHWTRKMKVFPTKAQHGFFSKYEDWSNDLFKSLSTSLVLCWGKYRQWHLLANKNARWKLPVQYPSFQNCLGRARTKREGNWTKLLCLAVWHQKWLQTVVKPSPNSTVFPKGMMAIEKESPSQMVFLLSGGHCFVLFACI